MENGDIYFCFKKMVFPAVGAFFAFSYIFAHKAEQHMTDIGKYFAALVWINFFLMIVYPHGVIFSNDGSSVTRANWLWGSKNNIVQNIPVVLAFLFMGIDSNGKKWLRWITIIVFYISIASMGSYGCGIFNGSTTALLMNTLSVILILLKNNKMVIKIITFLNSGRIAFIGIVFSALIIYISLNVLNIRLLILILNALGKDISFSFRDKVWWQMVKYIHDFWLLGIGEQKVYLVYTETTYSFWGSLLMRYGICGLALLMAVIGLSDKKIKKISDNIYVFRICMISFSVAVIANEISYRTLFILLMIGRCFISRDNEKIRLLNYFEK
jgi:hypothetical protein